jgi:hypothetical protein
MHYYFGLAATLLGIIGAAPYIFNTFRRKTKPHRIAWLIFLILSIIIFTSQFALGARASLIFYGWTMVNNIVIFSLSMRKNGGYGDISPLNIACFCLAVIAILLWGTTSSPILALISVLVADGIGSTLIVFKAYKHPYTETLFMWSLGIIAGALNILAVGRLVPSQLAAPTYITVFCLAISVAIILGKLKHPKPKRQYRKKLA